MATIMQELYSVLIIVSCWTALESACDAMTMEGCRQHLISMLPSVQNNNVVAPSWWLSMSSQLSNLSSAASLKGQEVLDTALDHIIVACQSLRTPEPEPEPELVMGMISDVNRILTGHWSLLALFVLCCLLFLLLDFLNPESTVVSLPLPISDSGTQQRTRRSHRPAKRVTRRTRLVFVTSTHAQTSAADAHANADIPDPAASALTRANQNDLPVISFMTTLPAADESARKLSLAELRAIRPVPFMAGSDQISQPSTPVIEYSRNNQEEPSLIAMPSPVLARSIVQTVADTAPVKAAATVTPTSSTDVASTEPKLIELITPQAARNKLIQARQLILAQSIYPDLDHDALFTIPKAQRDRLLSKAGKKRITGLMESLGLSREEAEQMAAAEQYTDRAEENRVAEEAGKRQKAFLAEWNDNGSVLVPCSSIPC